MSDEAERQAVETDCCWITVGSRSRHSKGTNRNTNTMTTSLTDRTKPQEKPSSCPIIAADGSYFQILAEDDDEEGEDNDEEEKELEHPTCSICFELVNVIRGRLECSHVFCFSCVEEWCGREPSCPLCRHEVTSIVKLDANQSLVDGETISVASRMRNFFENGFMEWRLSDLRDPIDLSNMRLDIFISYSWDASHFFRRILERPEVPEAISILTDVSFLDEFELSRDVVDVTGGKCISNTRRGGRLLEHGRFSSNEGIT